MSPRKGYVKGAKKAEIAQRRGKLAELMGLSLRDAEKVLQQSGLPGVTHMTLQRDMKALAKSQSPHVVEQKRQQAEDKLTALEHWAVTEADLSDPETIAALLNIHDRIARLTGINAAEKVELKGYQEPDWHFAFCEAAHGLEEAEYEKIWEFIRAMPRKPMVIDASFYPPAKELLP
jgi:hypothetical protein